jgi:hypothetical protein
VKNLENIGLSNIAPEKTTILHSTAMGRRSYGRISDLFCAWLESEAQFETKQTASLRLLISGLLEAFPKKENASTRIELATFDGQVFVAVRAECGIVVDLTQVERSFTQFWLNSEEPQLLKKVLHAADRIEVRYQQKTGLMEWRVCRPISGEIDPHESGSFLVFTDPREDFQQPEANYRDLGDTPYKKWLEDVYRSANEDSASGAILIEGDETQAQIDLSRVKVGGEIREIDEEVTRIHPDPKPAPESVARISGKNMDSSARTGIYDDLLQKIRSHESIEADLQDRIEALKHDDEKKTSQIERLKVQKLGMAELLNKKQREILRREVECKTLKFKLKQKRDPGANESLDGGGANAHLFRDKAIEMFQKLKLVQTENDELSAQLRALRNERVGKTSTDPDPSFGESANIRMSTEEIEKKLERMQRSLEAEKAKVKGLLDRTLAAEKESQASAPIMSDLEAKVEHQLKTSIQYKKEIDNLKQKVVQAEAEKNKVKNELIKAQAQIQTLTKRLAG